jgi:hypothetical protein
LRQRLSDDLRLRNSSPRASEAAVAAVAKLARHFGTTPDRLTPNRSAGFSSTASATGPRSANSTG